MGVSPGQGVVGMLPLDHTEPAHRDYVRLEVRSSPGRWATSIVSSQMTKTGVFGAWAGWDNVANLHHLASDHDPIDGQFDRLATLLKGRVGQPFLRASTEVRGSLHVCRHVDLLVLRSLAIALLHTFGISTIAAQLRHFSSHPGEVVGFLTDFPPPKTHKPYAASDSAGGWEPGCWRERTRQTTFFGG